MLKDLKVLILVSQLFFLYFLGMKKRKKIVGHPSVDTLVVLNFTLE